MSANASAPAASAEQGPVANRFTLSDENGTTQITFYPVAPGPLVAGQAQGGSRLEYTDEEGNREFSGDDIQIEDSIVGRLITVTLQPNADAGALLLTLILPSIALSQDSTSEPFKTVAIRTRTRGFVLPRGADRSYSVIDLGGTAESAALPL